MIGTAAESVPDFLPDHPTVLPAQKIWGSIMAISTREDEERTSKFAAVLKHVATRRRRSAAGGRRFATSPLGRADVGAGRDPGSGRGRDSSPTCWAARAPTSNVLTEKVRKSDLVVSITEDGNVESCAQRRHQVRGAGRQHDLVADQGRHAGEEGGRAGPARLVTDRREDQPAEDRLTKKPRPR